MGRTKCHQMVLNRFLTEEGSEFWHWPVAGEHAS